MAAQVRKPPLKCPEFRSLLTDTPWLREEASQMKNLDLVRDVIDRFVDHASSACSCTFESSSKLLIASCYMQQFAILSKNAIASLGTIEKDLKENPEENKANLDNLEISTTAQTNKDYKSDFQNELQLESKFVSNYNKQVNVENLKFMLSVALKALVNFEEAFIAHENQKPFIHLSEKSLNNIFVLPNLNALYQIFTFYDLESYAYRAAQVAISFCELYNTDDILDSAEEVLISYHNLCRGLLNFGSHQMASSFFKDSFPNYTCDKVESIQNFGQALIFLLATELNLRERKGKDYAKSLKIFIDSEYFSRNTIKRYAGKIMALLMAGRFPSATYKFKENFAEFLEPIVMTLSICRRWNIFPAFYKADCNTMQDQPDPLWYKFTIFNLMNEAGDIFELFYINTGLVIEAASYFKFLLHLQKISLNIVG